MKSAELFERAKKVSPGGVHSPVRAFKGVGGVPPFIASAKGCRTATTGKDWVKWKESGIQDGSVIVLEPEAVFEEGRELWERILWG
jgi:hypothetical protein